MNLRGRFVMKINKLLKLFEIFDVLFTKKKYKYETRSGSYQIKYLIIKIRNK